MLRHVAVEYRSIDLIRPNLDALNRIESDVSTSVNQLTQMGPEVFLRYEANDMSRLAHGLRIWVMAHERDVLGV